MVLMSPESSLERYGDALSLKKRVPDDESRFRDAVPELFVVNG